MKMNKDADKRDNRLEKMFDHLGQMLGKVSRK